MKKLKRFLFIPFIIALSGSSLLILLFILLMFIQVTGCARLPSKIVDSYIYIAKDSLNQKKTWQLIWEDNFEGDKLDTTKWALISRYPEDYNEKADWCKHMTNDPMVYDVADGKLYLKGLKNPDMLKDPRPFLTGGVESFGKFAFLYGKIEVRMKKECAHGAWPAIWMMAEHGDWPNSGEIDILEHLNFDSTIYQTVHTHYTYILKKRDNPPNSIRNVKADVNNWNTYGLEWYPDKLVFTLNGNETFVYPKLESLDPDLLQWPFDRPFYIRLTQQLGGSWVGEVNPNELPVSMIIDFVKVYQ